jgi:hypothetical protein
MSPFGQKTYFSFKPFSLQIAAIAPAETSLARQYTSIQEPACMGQCQPIA